jgi:hypothetical protein
VPKIQELLLCKIDMLKSSNLSVSFAPLGGKGNKKIVKYSFQLVFEAKIFGLPRP